MTFVATKFWDRQSSPINTQYSHYHYTENRHCFFLFKIQETTVQTFLFTTATQMTDAWQNKLHVYNLLGWMNAGFSPVLFWWLWLKVRRIKQHMNVSPNPIRWSRLNLQDGLLSFVEPIVFKHVMTQRTLWLHSDSMHWFVVLSRLNCTSVIGALF